MTFPDDRDPAVEELLRSTLAAEADAVAPHGDGLARIQQRIARRRSHRLWLVPTAAVGSAAVLAGAAVGAYALTHQSSRGDDRVVPIDSTSPTTVPPSTPAVVPTTPPPVTPAYPPTAFFPFASSDQEQAWERSGGPTTQPWVTDATQTAQHFLTDFVQQPSVSVVVRRALGTDRATVTLGRPGPDGSTATWAVTVVHLVREHKAWLVTGAGDAHSSLTVAAPPAGASATTPMSVSGPAFGVDESARVELRTSAGLVATAAPVSFGNGSGSWRTSLRWTSSPLPRGGVVVTVDSQADGGPARIAVVPVSFDPSSVQPVPSYFYGVKNGEVTQYAARDGASLRYLTKGMHASDPQRVQGTVYFLDGDPGCGAALRSVPVQSKATATADTVATPDSGYSIASYAVSADGTRVALWEQSCANQAQQPQGQLVGLVLASHSRHAIAFPSFPPMVVGDPAWEPDGEHVDAVVRTGNEAGVQRFDVFKDTSPTDAADACTGWSPSDGLPGALRVDAAGTLWVAAQTGSSMRVARCVAGSVTTAFDVSGNGTPGDLAVTDDGSAALLTDGGNGLWRWDAGSGEVTPLHPRVPQPQVSW